MLNKKKLYWYAQLIGWLVYVFIVGLFNKLNGSEISAELIYSLLSIYLIGISISHFFRAIINKLHWMKYSLGLLVPRVLSSVFVLGVIIYLVQNVVLDVLIAHNSFEIDLVDAFPKVINWTLLLLLWSLFYFLFHFINNYKKEEIKNLKWQAAKNEIELNKIKSQLKKVTNKIQNLVCMHEDHQKSLAKIQAEEKHGFDNKNSFQGKK